MKKIKKILSVLLIIAILGISETSISEAATYGSTNSNIKNGGIALKYNDYYYNVSECSNYVYSYDNYDGTAPGWVIHSYDIYKKKSSSGKIIDIIAENALSIPFLNSRNGYIYYLGMSTTTGKPGVYRVKTDGTSMKRLATVDLTSYRVSPSVFLPMIVKDNYIYYCPDHYSINRISLTGGSKKTIYKSPTWIGFFSLSGSYIYVNNITNRSHFPDTKYSIYRVTTNGSNKKLIYRSVNDIYDAMYYNGYIFYTRYNDGYNYLYRMNSDGSNKKCLIKTTNYIDYCVYNSKIYYTLNRDKYDEFEDTRLRTCSLSGTNKKILFKYSHFYIQAITGNVVYVDTLRGTGTYNLSTEEIDFPCL